MQGGLWQNHTLLAWHKTANQYTLNLLSHQLGTRFGAALPDSVLSACLSGCHLGVQQSYKIETDTGLTAVPKALQEIRQIWSLLS